MAWTISQAEALGEPFRTLLHPAETEDLLRRHGFRTVEDNGPVGLRRSYFPDRPELGLPGIERIAVANL